MTTASPLERLGKTCPKCGAYKTRACFGRNASAADGMQGYCRECANEYQRQRNGRNRRRPQLQETREERNLRYRLARYRLTVPQYEALLAAQGGRCACCGVDPWEEHAHRAERMPHIRWPDPILVVDHDHACCPGKGRTCGECVRGLLCIGCNGQMAAFDAGRRTAFKPERYERYVATIPERQEAIASAYAEAA
ncbi:endonuclease domain-containing protein [Micromonospora musae]|uniref:endonuclease domain-containing protein n=1 Tax=Micromonospora musae TaxID=1894970 RepID=UPI0034261B25